MSGMKRSKIVKMWAELGSERPSFGDFENYMNRPMSSGPYGFVRCGDILEYFLRGEFWWMYLDVRRRQCSKRVARLKAAERRPKYYAAENERRRGLAAERRRVRARTTTSPCPTRDAVLEAWNRRKDSHEAAIRFGSILEDLECYIDNSLRRDEDGVIVGRNPGIKGWLRENLPEILDKYTTAMRYKAAAKKLKQIVELADPTPADVVLPRRGAKEEDVKRDYGADEIVESSERKASERNEADDVPELAVVRARALWGEIVGGIGPSATALIVRLDALTNPERVEDANMLAAWREKYMNEITVRTKRKWWRRLVKEAKEKMGNGRLARRKAEREKAA